MLHLDLSTWAFEKLASKKWGVISIKLRAVPCNHKPYKPAPPADSPTPGQAPPPGARDPSWNPTQNTAPTKQWSNQQSNDVYQPYATLADALAAGAVPGAGWAGLQSLVAPGWACVHHRRTAPTADRAGCYCCC